MRSTIVLFFAALTLSACGATTPVANVGEVKNAATAYHEHGYEQELAEAILPAKAWVKTRASQVKNPAIVFDIDETSLSNWAAIKANDYGYFPKGSCNALPKGPCGWDGWIKRGEATAIAPTRELYREAQAQGVALFFISGRYESQRMITDKNLRVEGFSGWKAMHLKKDGVHYGSATDFKAALRTQIEADGYTIIANIGDQDSDFTGGHAERTFKLPNPFYYIP